MKCILSNVPPVSLPWQTRVTGRWSQLHEVEGWNKKDIFFTGNFSKKHLFFTPCRTLHWENFLTIFAIYTLLEIKSVLTGWFFSPQNFSIPALTVYEHKKAVPRTAMLKAGHLLIYFFILSAAHLISLKVMAHYRVIYKDCDL